MGRMSGSLVQRGQVWQMRRAVPVEFAHVESRREVTKTMRTDSRSEAERKAQDYWAALEAGWRAKLAGDDPAATDRFDTAQKIAAGRGHPYVVMEDLAKGPLADILARVEAISKGGGKPDPVEAGALLGTVPKPAILLSTVFNEFWKLSVEDRKGKSDDQIRRWRNPHIKALRNLVAVIGDKPLAEVTRDDMLDFRDWWEQRIEVEDLTENAANKDLIHVGKMFRRINNRKRLGIDLPLGELSFKEVAQNKRPPFSDTFLQKRLLAPDALDGMNAEARAILLATVNTGARSSEIAGLMPEHIVLDGDCPHLKIRPIGRTLKSRRAQRDLPLTGISLEAMKEFPDGFPRYRKTSANLSATVNKFLRERGLVESKRHTMYSIRHAFMNRMIVNGVDDRIRRDLMGHRLETEEYGDAGGVTYSHKVLVPFAL